MISDTIQRLDSLRAQQILKVLVQSETGITNNVPWNSALAELLGREFQVEPEAALVSEGQLARQALLVLAEDPRNQQAVVSMADRDEARAHKYDVQSTIELVAAVLLVLQTRIRFERHPDGKWSLQLEKRPTSDSLLKALVQKLISYAKQ